MLKESRRERGIFPFEAVSLVRKLSEKCWMLNLGRLGYSNLSWDRLPPVHPWQPSAGAASAGASD